MKIEDNELSRKEEKKINNNFKPCKKCQNKDFCRWSNIIIIRNKPSCFTIKIECIDFKSLED